MSKRAHPAHPFPIQLENTSVPLQVQLYEEFRKAILQGRLKKGTRLESTRELAEQLHISRNTAASAYERLLAEGYIVTRAGSGTYVCSDLPEEHLFTQLDEVPKKGRTLSRAWQILASSRIGVSLQPSVFRPFSPGVPALDEFPFPVWQRLAAKHWRDPARALLDYGDPSGHSGLKKEIADYLRAARAVECDAEQVIIVSGTQQGLDLTARLILDPDDVVWMEDPGYPAAKAVFRASGARIVPVPVDDEGLDVENGKQMNPDPPRLIYVTPSHQYPLGVTMSISRRLALLEWANNSGAWIIEDDYDSDFRYSGRPLRALQGLDKQQRVIYIGTFSKVLLPSLRLGYVVVPPDMTADFARARAALSHFSPGVDQAILCEFMQEGHFTRHIRRMRELYTKRRDALCNAIERSLSGMLEIQPADCGIHLVGWLPRHMKDKNVSLEADAEGVEAQPLSAFATGTLKRGGLVLGYAAFSEKEIRAAVRKLATALRRCRKKN